MELHGLLRDPQFLADRRVREALRDGLQNRELALGQASGLAETLLVDLGKADGVKHGSLDGLPDRRRQIDRIDALDDVAARAVLERGLDPLGVAEDRENDYLDVGAVL